MTRDRAEDDGRPEAGASWCERIPKAELHLHLEGAIPLDALWELVQKYGGDPLVPDLATLRARFVYQDFAHFIQAWNWKNCFLRECEDFTFVAEAVAQDLLRQNIRYVEAFFSPSDFREHALTPQGLAVAIRAGLERVPGVEVALIADLVRNRGARGTAETLADVAEVRDQGIIGIGIGGSEAAFPPELFTDVYAEARRLGFHTTVHAGEAAGPASVWGALCALHAERIGHGTRAIEDPALMDYLAEHRVPIEMCPISNVRTGVVPTLADHPIRRFFERGIPVTVNTDDPGMFGNSLAGEYEQLQQVLGFTRKEIRTLVLNAIETSWLPDDRKRQLAAAFQADPAWGEE